MGINIKMHFCLKRKCITESEYNRSQAHVLACELRLLPELCRSSGPAVPVLANRSCIRFNRHSLHAWKIGRTTGKKD